MADNAPPEMTSGNPCCISIASQWQGKYISMKKRRDAFKEVATLLQKAVADGDVEKSNLEKKLAEMAAAEKDTKGNDAVVIQSLSKENTDLKSEILSLKQKMEKNVKENNQEMMKLKELIKKEALRADNCDEEREKVCKELIKTKAMIVKDEENKMNVPEVSKELSMVKNLLASERKKAELERKRAESEKKRADQYFSELEVLRATAHKGNSDLLTLKSNIENVKKQLEIEKQKAVKERRRADMESAKAKEQKKLVEGLSKNSEESAKRINDLTQQLQEAQFVIDGLKKQLHELTLTQKSIKTHSIPHDKIRDLDKAELRLMKKQLKFERKCRKHAKKVAEFENLQKKIKAKEELGRLKEDLGSFAIRMKLLEKNLSRDIEGTSGLEKGKGHKTIQPQNKRTSEKNSDARCHLVGSQEQGRKLSAVQLVPHSVSGTIITQLESPTGGSGELQGSGDITSATSYSDGQVLASSQRREQDYATTTAEIAKDKPIIQPTKSSVVLRKISDTAKSAKPRSVVENFLQSRQKRIHEVANDQSRKRKSMVEAVDSPKQIGNKIGTLQSKVVGKGCRGEEGPLAADLQGNCTKVSKKRKVSCGKKTFVENILELNLTGKSPSNIARSTEVAGKTMSSLSTGKGHDPEILFLDDIIATDYMKLLELDNLEEESYYKMARESLLSPDLPQIDFLGGEIVNEDRNPAKGLDSATSISMDICDTPNDSVTVKMPTTTLHGHIPENFVVFSNIEDQSSIVRIFHAANNCIQLCPSVSKGQWAVQEILFSMKMEEEHLLGQERVCVLLSLLLHNFSVVSPMKIGDTLDVESFSCLDSFSKHIYGAMADNEAGGMFSEELLSLLQDFLFEQRVLVSVKAWETSDLTIPVTLNGENIALVRRSALIDHLIAGSAIFAAICTALGRIGFICENSFEILHKYSHDKTSVVLTILHVFAYVGGEKMASSSEHDVSIAVLKSIVMFLEKKGNAKLHPCNNSKCPFSEGSSSLEATAAMLMNILQESTQSQILTGSTNLEKTEFRPTHKDFQCNNFYDILSLVETIASYTAWDWTSANIVTPLLKMLGMSLPIHFSVAIVSLLGQLSSIGVEAVGYGNEGISNVREKLSAFLQFEATLKAGFAVQIATVSSLLKTLPLDFTIAFQGKTNMLPDSIDQRLSASVNLVNKWFSLLSDEQRVFASEFFKTSVVR